MKANKTLYLGNIIGGDNIHAIGEADVSKNPHNKPPISGSSKPAETPQVPAAESDTDEVDDNFSDEDSEGGYGENEDENDLNEEGGENVPDSYPLVQK